MSRVEFRTNVKRVNGALESGVSRNVEQAAELFRQELNKTLRGNRSGREYRVPGGTSRTYTASAPGEPPARRTGTLANSFDTAKTSPTRMLVGSPLVYARLLEIGTRDIRPRPYFRKTFDANQRRIRAVLARQAIEGRRR